MSRTPANKGRRLPAELLSGEEVRALLRACSARAPTGIRNRALIAALYRGGLRISEALALLPKDIDSAQGTLTVLHGKGDRRRTVGMDPAAFALLERWMDRRRALGLSGRRPVFCTLAGERAEDRTAAREPKRPPAVHPALEQGEGGRVHADRPAAVSLAVEDREGALRRVDVLGEEGEGLRDAQAAAVEGGDQRPVSDAGRCPRRARAQQGADLLAREELGGEAAALVGRGATHGRSSSQISTQGRPTSACSMASGMRRAAFPIMAVVEEVHAGSTQRRASSPAAAKASR